MVKGKARAAGSFLGGLANNPAIVIIALVLGGLFIFRDRISGALEGIGGSLGKIDIQLPEIKLPEINFPEITFPDFPSLPDFSSIFSGFQSQLDDLSSSIAGQTVTGAEGQDVMIPPDTVIDPDTGIVTSSTPPTQDTTTGETEAGGFPIGFFAQQRAGVFDTLTQTGGLTASQAFALLKDVPFGDINALGQVLEDFNAQGIEAAPTNVLNAAGSIAEQKEEIFGIDSFLIDEPTQKFEGGGLSFIGGSIFETPITGQSTLSFIIDQLGVSASEAASIRAELRGFTQEEALFLAPKVITPFGTVFDAAGGGGGGVNVSNQQFAGLTPQQIALQLTGGNISNF